LLQDNTLKQQQIVVDTVSIDEFIAKNHLMDHKISPEKLIKLLLDNNFEPFTFTQQGALQPVNLSEILNSLEVTELFWKNNSLQ
jgi:hypothetical protein